VHRKTVIFSWAVLIIILLSSAVFAQDPGIPDTVRVDSIQIDADPVNPVVFSVRTELFNDELLNAGSLGLYYNSDDIVIDSISLIGGCAEHTFTQCQDSALLHLAVIGFFYYPGFPGQEQVQPGDSLLATLWFTLAAGAEDQTIDIDSGFFPPAGDFILTKADGSSLAPQFKKGKIVVGEGTPPQPIIALSPTSFSFNAIIGEPNPPTQALNITNAGEGTLNWSASWQSTWLSVMPTGGTAPSSPGVAVNISGLTAGTYYDTITVSSPTAINTPQYVPVTLNVAEPPPVIQLVPDEFYFVAMQDSANPESQFMTINDIGGGTLSWSAANSEAWLSLSDYAGGPGETIELMVDITGLTYGLYYDSIEVSDPNASNTPQYAQVTLEVVSSFPVLAVAPDDFHVGAYDNANPYDRSMFVINAGGGTLEYKITSKKEWLSFSPDSGSTGSTQEIAVSFQSVGQDLGFHYDTITVTSSNGSESPQTIPVVMWVMINPPELNVGSSQLVFTGFECQNVPPIDPQSFEIINDGLEDLDWTATWNASWLDIDPEWASSDATVWVNVDEGGLDVGTYIDTITIESVWSVTPSPQYVEIVFNVMEYPGPPELQLNLDYMEFIFLAGHISVVINPSLQIGNAVSGCMDWYINSPYPWLEFYPSSGVSATKISTFVRGGGLPKGITSGSFVVHAPGAIPDSAVVNFDIYVSQLGDANCDGDLNVIDVVYIINYVFVGGPAPVPRIWAGDVNCDGISNVEDAVWIINWIFVEGPYPCQYVPIIYPE
jgi:hypothetical protein